jgi:hypothetical protein
VRPLRLLRLLVSASSALAALALLPGSGLALVADPPTSDRFFRWPGAAALTVNVEPWGGGYVRSEPVYYVDCPLACVRPFDLGQSVTLRAYPTPGFLFEGWDGDCAGQPNPCTLAIEKPDVRVAAGFSGGFAGSPEAPPAAGEPSHSASADRVTVLVDVVSLGLLAAAEGGPGTVTDDFGEIACPGDCVGAYDAGVRLTLDAAPAPGFYFALWDAACAFAGAGSCSLTLLGDTYVVAWFGSLG